MTQPTPTPVLLPGCAGGPLATDYASKRIKKAAEKAGLWGTVTAHVLRHTYGAMLASEGVPIFTITQTMGHSSVTTTQKCYGHLYPEALHAAVEKVFGLAA